MRNRNRTVQLFEWSLEGYPTAWEVSGSNPGAINKFVFSNFLSYSVSQMIPDLLLRSQEKSDKNDGIIDLPNGRKEEADLKGYVFYYLLLLSIPQC